MDAAEILSAAVAERSLSDVRDVAAVIDARIRQRHRGLVPLPARSWSQQIPVLADPERQAFAAELAAMMDARAERIGEHAADQALLWAVAALGPVPANPDDRRDWCQRASVIGAYRELSGYDHFADPIGPEPVGSAPDKRAAWHHALAALGPTAGSGVRGLPDGMLLHLRDTYPTETARAPPYVADQFCQARLGAIRATAEAKAAANRGRAEVAARHEELAASYQAMRRADRNRETVLAGVMDDRAVWEQATARQRGLAVAADAELRRRHPDQQLEPLRSAEPHSEPAAGAEVLSGQRTPGSVEWVTDLAAGRRVFARQLAERHAVSVGIPVESHLCAGHRNTPSADC